jgi:hypothetical protein
MAIEHVNRRGDTYYLHEGKTKTGKPTFFFSRKREGALAEAIPPGFEVYENPNAQVFLRKALPRLVTDEEVATVERAVRKQGKLTSFVIDVKGKSIVIHLGYSPMMRFTLVDEQRRVFAVDRWCFLGSIDDWFPLSGGGDLERQVAKYCPHLGRESFYELM